MVVIAQGNSMLPQIKHGDKLLVEPVSISMVNTGDIVVFMVDNFFICHRVVKVLKMKNGKTYLKTKGDNCDCNDPYVVSSDNLLGKVISAFYRR